MSRKTRVNGRGGVAKACVRAWKETLSALTVTMDVRVVPALPSELRSLSSDQEMVKLVGPCCPGLECLDERERKTSFEALTLPSAERAEVAAELLASLDDTETDIADIEAAWAIEIEKRARVRAGKSQGISWDDVRRRADDELRRQ